MKLPHARNALALLLVAVATVTTVTLRRLSPPAVRVARERDGSVWPATLLRVGERRELRFLVRTDCPPFSAVGQDGETPVGLDPDTAQVLAAHLGVACRIVAVPRREIVSRFLRGEGDVLAAAVSSGSTDARLLDFTLPCYRSRDVMIVTNAAAERLAGGLPEPARLGLLAGAAHGDAVLRGLGCGQPAAIVQRWEDLVSCLRDNGCDAVLADALTAHYLLSSHADSGLSLLPVSMLNRHPSAVCLAVRKGASELRHSLDRALHDMELDGSLRRVHHRYFPFDID